MWGRVDAEAPALLLPEGIGAMMVASTPLPETRPSWHYLEQCACCGYFTISRPIYSFDSPGERCPVCGWITDFLQERDAQLGTGRNPVCLRQACGSFVMTGSAHAGVRELVRPPRADELGRQLVEEP